MLIGGGEMSKADLERVLELLAKASETAAVTAALIRERKGGK